MSKELCWSIWNAITTTRKQVLPEQRLANIYRLDDYYKETILAPFRELLSYAPEELEFIRYENDDFYIGQTDGNGNPHGTGLYHWAREKGFAGDLHSEMFVGRWKHGEQTNDGSQIHHASDDTKTWFEACSEASAFHPSTN